MARFDLKSVAVMGAALLASFGTAAGVRHFSGDDGMAFAATASADISSAVARVRKGDDGHYWAEATIDGRAVRVLVDTGSSLVALTREDAERLGVKLVDADFTGSVQTASGLVPAAPVELEAVAVGGARIERVQALVVREGLAYSLLGMSYLGRLSGFEATPSGLTLRL